MFSLEICEIRGSSSYKSVLYTFSGKPSNLSLHGCKNWSSPQMVSFDLAELNTSFLLIIDLSTNFF